MIDFNFELGLLRAKKTLEYFANQPVLDSNGIVIAQSNTPQMTESEIIDHFISNNFLVKERNRNSRHGYDIFKRNHALNRYESIKKKELTIDFEEYLYSTNFNIDIPQSVENMINSSSGALSIKNVRDKVIVIAVNNNTVAYVYYASGGGEKAEEAVCGAESG